jgi:glycosyltransferase involved in cell wall biosynthesis|tara:strand:+ start:545 stop:1303 length:759 start_codon:yes stop_codon:yes gene_type:complete
MQKNLLSIITVVKNDEQNIQKTIKSIISQKNINYEYIIIDGKSTDNTLKKIRKYKSKINKIISKKDNGIYDAMNKGIKVANGDVIVFCNSGDFFYKNSLQKVMLLFDKFNYDFIFGTVLRNYKKGKILKFGFNFNRMLYNFDFATSHSTGFFLKKKIYNLIGNYNTKFKISADYDLYFRLYKKNLRGGYTKKNQKIGNMKSGGFSSKMSFFQHLIEETKIRIHNSQNILFVLLIFVNAIFKNFNKLFLQNKN